MEVDEWRKTNAVLRQHGLQSVDVRPSETSSVQGILQAFSFSGVGPAGEYLDG